MKRIRVRPFLLILGAALLMLGVLWATKAVSWEALTPGAGYVGGSVSTYRIDWMRVFVAVSAIVVGVADLVYAFRYPDK